jgi:hypothetical protein
MARSRQRSRHVRIRVLNNDFDAAKRRIDGRLSELLEDALRTGEAKAKRTLKPGHGVDTGEMEGRIASGITKREPGRVEGSIYLRRGAGDIVKDIVNEYGSSEMEPNTFLRPAASSAYRSLISRARKIGQGL